jgi:hypothetical protein
MKISIAILPLFIGLTLTACGGGGSSTTKPITDKSSSNSSSVTNQSSSSEHSPDFDAVTGLYDASIVNDNIKDESYLYVGGNGKITAYNYMGDSKDLGNNCYREATGADINVNITGKTLSYSAANLEYTANIDSNTITWKLDSDKKLSKISYNNLISGSKISLTVTGTSLVVDSKTITSPSITDITTNLCR